jgi:hypothetical protein
MLPPKGNCKCKSEMRGSLRSAAHDEAVSCFGRDDVLAGVEEGNCNGNIDSDGKNNDKSHDKSNGNGKSRSFDSTARKARAVTLRMTLRWVGQDDSSVGGSG